MLSMLLMMIAGQDADALIANARKLTAAEPRCEQTPGSTDITVCGLRAADHYRAPLVVHDPGDRRYESVAAERERLTHRSTRLEDMSAFLVETGMAGVSASTNGSQTSVAGLRTPAP